MMFYKKEIKLTNHEISICPTLVFPLIGKSAVDNVFVNSVHNPSFNVRTLLDDGSSVNWIAPNILKYIKYQTICHVMLTVKTFDGHSRSKYKLVEVYVNNEYLNSIKCFVMHSLSEAQSFPNIAELLNNYFIKHNLSLDVLSSWTNPYSAFNISHDSSHCMTKGGDESRTIPLADNMTYQCGMIVSSHIINKI